jgi:hypothetical protein
MWHSFCLTIFGHAPMITLSRSYESLFVTRLNLFLRKGAHPYASLNLITPGGLEISLFFRWTNIIFTDHVLLHAS